MPLCMVSDGESFLIKKIMGKEEVRRFLENLGFVAGAQVSLVSKIGGKRRIFECLGAPRKQNSYNSGVNLTCAPM